MSVSAYDRRSRLTGTDIRRYGEQLADCSVESESIDDGSTWRRQNNEGPKRMWRAAYGKNSDIP